MANVSEAYDFSLFETHYDNTVPAREPQRAPKRAPRRAVVAFPKEAEKPQPRRKRHPLRALFTAMSFAVLLSLCVAMVYSQQQLAELTDRINTASEQLTEEQSVEVQLKMEAARKMNGAQVESYAQNTLGMTKMLNSQITYLSVDTGDRGTVVQDPSGGSPIDRLLHRIERLFS